MTKSIARRRLRRPEFARLAVVSLVVAGFAAPPAAHATKSRFSTGELCQILQPCQPPAAYASGPFLGKPVVRQVSMKQVQSICGNGDHAVSGFPNGIFGCAQLTGGACIVHVPADLKAAVPELYRLVLAHELGHCRGWVHARY